MSRILQFVVAVILVGVVAGCSRPVTTTTGTVEATNAAGKQSWETPPNAGQLDQLRNRLAHTQRDH